MNTLVHLNVLYGFYKYVISFQIYIESKLITTCQRVRSGDRLGVFLTDAPGAIGYTFDGRRASSLAYTLPNKTQHINIGGQVGFGNLLFPYVFSVAAYIDTSKYICLIFVCLYAS